MMIDVRKAPSQGGVTIRDNATRVWVFVSNTELMAVAARLLDEADRHRELAAQRLGR